MNRCETHRSGGPCPWCAWAASGDPTKARAAGKRADRVAGRPPAEFRPPPTRRGDGPTPRARPKPPRLARMAWSFLGALIKHSLAGFPQSGPLEKAARLAACKACPLLLPDNRCGDCGCNLGLKSAWEGSKCRRGRWPEAKS